MFTYSRCLMILHTFSLIIDDQRMSYDLDPRLCLLGQVTKVVSFDKFSNTCGVYSTCSVMTIVYLIVHLYICSFQEEYEELLKYAVVVPSYDPQKIPLRLADAREPFSQPTTETLVKVDRGNATYYAPL